MGLKVRALAMTTGVRHEDLFVTRNALRLHFRTHRRAAVFHRAQGMLMAWQRARCILRQKRRLKGVDDGSEPDHLTSPHAMENRAIKALIRWEAFSPVLAVRCVYFAVVRIEWWPRIFCTSSRSTPASIRWVA